MRTGNDFGVKSLCLMLTRRCNLYCQHCFLEAGPDCSEEMDKHDLARILETSGTSVKKLWFSGGEPTVTLDLLKFGLQRASELRRSIGLPMEIFVQTNAAWATDARSALSMLADLARWGATGINIAANDVYHWRQIGRDTPDLAYRMARAMGVFSAVDLSGIVDPSGPRRLGRGKGLPMSEIATSEFCTITWAGYVSDTDGQLYPCCFPVSASLGNLLERPLTQLIADESQLGWPVLLREGGPELVCRELTARMGCALEQSNDESLCEFCSRVTHLWDKTLNGGAE